MSILRGRYLTTPLALDNVRSAATHLRRYYKNVFPCTIVLTEYGGPNKRTVVTWGDERGLPDGGDGFYFVMGPGIVTHVELIELACKCGWREG